MRSQKYRRVSLINKKKGKAKHKWELNKKEVCKKNNNNNVKVVAQNVPPYKP